MSLKFLNKILVNGMKDIHAKLFRINYNDISNSKFSVLWYSTKSVTLCTLKNTFMFHDHNSVFTLDQRNFGIVDKLPTIICLVYDVANAFLPIHSNFKWVHKATWINKAVNRLP